MILNFGIFFREKAKNGRKKGKKGEKIPPGYPRTNMKIPFFFLMLHPRIFQDSKSRDFLVPGFVDPEILRDM